MTEKDGYDSLSIGNIHEVNSEEDGLASKFQQGDPVMDVVMMLQQGATPEELLQGGIPMQLIEQAMMVMRASAPKSATDEEQGLANMLSGM